MSCVGASTPDVPEDEEPPVDDTEFDGDATDEELLFPLTDEEFSVAVTVVLLLLDSSVLLRVFDDDVLSVEVFVSTVSAPVLVVVLAVSTG